MGQWSKWCLVVSIFQTVTKGPRASTQQVTSRSSKDLHIFVPGYVETFTTCTFEVPVWNRNPRMCAGCEDCQYGHVIFWVEAVLILTGSCALIYQFCISIASSVTLRIGSYMVKSSRASCNMFEDLLTSSLFLEFFVKWFRIRIVCFMIFFFLMCRRLWWDHLITIWWLWK